MADADTSSGRGRSLRVFRALLRAPSLLALLIANLLPIYGVVALGWDLFSLIMVYWLETGVIGFFAIINIALVAGLRAVMLVPFFIVHFSGFMLGHMLFLITFFGSGKNVDLPDAPEFVLNLIIAKGLLYAVAALFVSHGIVFVIYVLLPWLGRLRRGEWKTGDVEVGTIMGAPYVRIIIMHVTILFGAILVVTFNNRLALLLLLIVLKTAVDLWSLLRRPPPAPVVVTTQ